MQLGRRTPRRDDQRRKPWREYDRTKWEDWAFPSTLARIGREAAWTTHGRSISRRRGIASGIPSRQGEAAQNTSSMSSGISGDSDWSATCGLTMTQSHRLNVKWLARGEKLGYQTQKPEGLLERIISSFSSNEGDIVLDPFCGCGTAVVAAQRLKRRWIGIDITPLAINLIKKRLADIFGSEIRKSYDVIGEPSDRRTNFGAGCARSWRRSRIRRHFQYWALGLVNARPGGREKRRRSRHRRTALFPHRHQGQDAADHFFCEGRSEHQRGACARSARRHRAREGRNQAF